MICSCFFNEEEWDEVVTRWVKFQFTFDYYDKIQIRRNLQC
jgi:hypothetical protein